MQLQKQWTIFCEDIYYFALTLFGGLQEGHQGQRNLHHSSPRLLFQNKWRKRL